MYVDYDFYKTEYNGGKLSEDNFNKFISKAEDVISRYTMDRVKENTLNSFPSSLVVKIKKCACELAEFCFDVSRINDLVSIKDDGIAGVIKSKSAGAVSITYDTALSTSNYLDQTQVNKRYKSILNEYLYPQLINGNYYNLLSWVK